MQELKCEYLVLINGGGKISGAIINYVTKAFKLVFDLGRALGSSIRRIRGNEFCPIKEEIFINRIIKL